jgi:wyosine [tRNA(Phe)-imidazoG37] synthetase (radical SAM superfamily)
MPTLIRYRGIIYGPVQSRRLGISLGINLLPPERKICPFNCVYCECGDTTELVEHVAEDAAAGRSFPTVQQVHAAVQTALKQHQQINAICFSGHGEPTLHPSFPEIVQTVRDLRDHHHPAANIGVFSSAALIKRPRPRAGIDLCDLRMLKLDAADEQTFYAIDRPAPNVHIATIIDELARMPAIIIQTCLIDGPVQNIRGEPWEALVQAIATIQPHYVQLYAIDRPTPEAWVQKVPHETVVARAKEMQARTGIEVDAY